MAGWKQERLDTGLVSCLVTYQGQAGEVLYVQINVDCGGDSYGVGHQMKRYQKPGMAKRVAERYVRMLAYQITNSVSSPVWCKQ